MVYGYIRVSTDKQDCANQKLGIECKATALGLVIEKYIEDDGISGICVPEKRALGNLMRNLQPHDIIICSELSRLGRQLFMVIRVLENIMKMNAKLYTVKEGYELGDNIQSKVLAFAFGLAAEIERDLISQRTREALAYRKSIGIKLGRPQGSKNKQMKLDKKTNLVSILLTRGLPKSAISKQLHVSRPTLDRFLKRKNLEMN